MLATARDSAEEGRNVPDTQRPPNLASGRDDFPMCHCCTPGNSEPREQTENTAPPSSANGAADGSNGDKPDEKKGTGVPWKTLAAIGGGALVGAAATPVLLTAAGFTSAGIAASSVASSLMSVSAVANGGGVAAGSLVATLQSAGAGGAAFASVQAGTGVVGGAVTGVS
eukprot:scpid23783/ scgid18651/ 